MEKISGSLLCKTAYITKATQIICILFFFLSPGYSQKGADRNSLLERKEIYFRIPAVTPANLSGFSIDRAQEGYYWCYAPADMAISVFSIPGAEIQTPPSMFHIPEMSVSTKDAAAWDVYPTYDDYVQMMYDFEYNHPDLCRVHMIGESAEGRKLLFIKISDNPGTREAEPEFMYSSSMHGDELVGYVLTLRLIDYLLTNYNSSGKVKRLIDSVEIWINPLSNPDGCYAGGNNTVYGATRFNANSVDMNRNFPDPADGEHPDGKQYQPENIAMMNFVSEHHFVISANLHGGAAVVNYPWDTWQTLHADDQWFRTVGRRYADTCHQVNPAYLTDLDNGITNGYQWYRITGGRQDYMNYFMRCREVTLELGSVKVPLSSDLPVYWENNYRSLLNYIEEAMGGIRGTVTDAGTGQALEAMIRIIGHDSANSEVYSDSANGVFYRPAEPGVYNLQISAPGYNTALISDIVVTDFKAAEVNCELTGYSGDKTVSDVRINQNPIASVLKVYVRVEREAQLKIALYDAGGKIKAILADDLLTKGMYDLQYNTENLHAGVYILRITTKDFIRSIKVVKIGQ